MDRRKKIYWFIVGISLSLLLGCAGPWETDSAGFYKLSPHKFSRHPSDRHCSGEGYVCASLVNREINAIESALGFRLHTPKIKKLYGKAKFIDLAGDNSGYNLAYHITVVADDFDKSQIPIKYRTFFDHFGYEVYFDFLLRDKDGFKLKTLNSGEDWKDNMAPGKGTLIQRIIRYKKIPVAIAKQTKSISFHMTINNSPNCERVLKKYVKDYKRPEFNFVRLPEDYKHSRPR